MMVWWRPGGDMEQRLLTHRTAVVTSPGALVITGTHREQLDQCGDTPGQYWNTLETHWPGRGTTAVLLSPGN